MNKCYWCGATASNIISRVYICDIHYKDFLECMRVSICKDKFLEDPKQNKEKDTITI